MLRWRCGSLGSRLHHVAEVRFGLSERLATPTRVLREYFAKVSESTLVRVGVPLPLETHAHGAGVNFAFFSGHASRVRLELFAEPEDATPTRVIELDPAHHRTGDVWHVWVAGIRPGQLYAYRVDGPYQPEAGHRFNVNKLLLDPIATEVTLLLHWDFGPAHGYDPSAPERDLVCSTVDATGAPPKCVFTREHFDFHDNQPAPATCCPILPCSPALGGQTSLEACSLIRDTVGYSPWQGLSRRETKGRHS